MKMITEKQKEIMTQNDIPFDESMTAEEARDAIIDELGKKPIEQERKDASKLSLEALVIKGEG